MAPEKSLLLQKPTFEAPHGGGKRMEKDSLEYATLVEWIRAGAPKGKAGSVRLTSIQVFPKDLRVLANQEEQQQFFVLGYYEDGSRADLTRIVQYVSGDEGVLNVSSAGLATAKRNGEVTVLVLYLAVPLSEPLI